MSSLDIGIIMIAGTLVLSIILAIVYSLKE